MRACEGCRRRKIKCDAATTNTWPCSACIRLKLHCVPPTVNYDQEFAPDLQGFPTVPTTINNSQFPNQATVHPPLGPPPRDISPAYSQHIGFNDGVPVYQPNLYGEGALAHAQEPAQFNAIHASNNVMQQNGSYAQQPIYTTQTATQTTSQNYDQDQFGQQHLADLLGELKMDEFGTGKSISCLSEI